jgi:hypothetical protein
VKNAHATQCQKTRATVPAGTRWLRLKYKVEKGKAYLKAEGWEKERVFKTEGKYTCDCGPDCKCNTISQNPGKCTCGAEMKAVKP